MRWRLIGMWRQWYSRQRNDEDLDCKLHSHLDLEAEEQQESGLAAEDARYATQRVFGNQALIKEDTHAMWGWIW